MPSTFVRGYWLGNFLVDFPYSIRDGLFWWLLFLVLFRAAFRKPWLAAVLYVLAFTALKGPLDGLPPVSWPFVACAQALGLALLVRCGVLAVISMGFVVYTLDFPITGDFSRFYAPDGLLAVGAVVALAGFGFWTARAGRPLFRDPALAE